ncbi:MAG: hypothetical protein Fues2KO_23420 [Fuerstiella sp.]
MTVSNTTDQSPDALLSAMIRNRSALRLTLCSLVTALATAGCESDTSTTPPPPTRTAHSADEAATANDKSDGATEPVTGERRSFDGLAFVVPESWTDIPLSGFQRGIITAILGMPEAGEEVTLSLSRASGGIDSNFDRWRGQFVSSREEITETLTIAGQEAQLIDLQGNFNPGFGKQANGEWRMIGVIVPLPGQSFFLKLTGPVEQVSSVEDDFRDFLKTAGVE